MICELCEEQEAEFKVSITEMDGTVIEHGAYCKRCLDGHKIIVSGTSGKPMI